LVETYTFTCTPTSGGAPLTDSVIVTIPHAAGAGSPRLHLYENIPAGTPFAGPITLTSAGGLVDLTWDSLNVASPCVSSSLPSDAGWDGTQATNSPPGYTISFSANPGTSTESYLYTLTCSPIDGSPDISRTVEIDIAAGTGTTGTGTGGTTGGRNHLPWIEF
jgi:hypothetical protein